MDCFKKKKLFTLLFAIELSISILGQSQIAPGTAPVNPPTGGFAIDGSLRRKGIAGDWLEGSNGSAPGTFLLDEALSPLFIGASFTWMIDRWNSNNDDVFKEGKNHFNANPNLLKWEFKKSNPKNDINNALIYLVRDNTGDIWAVFAGDRLGTKGYNYIDFEFFQNTVAKTPPTANGIGGFLSYGPNDGRTIGDIIVSVALGDNGGLLDVDVLQWQPTSENTFDYVSITNYFGGILALAATNTETIEVPFGAFGTTIYPPGTFAEAAINLSRVLGFSGPAPECNVEINLPFKTLWIKSKTSPYSNAKLIDFIEPVSFYPLNSTFGVSVSSIVLDNYTIELTASVNPGTVDDYNFWWVPNEFNPPGGSLNDDRIYNPVFTTTNPETCIDYVYTLFSAPKSELDCGFAVARINIRLPCKIGKPINPDKVNLNINTTNEVVNNKDEVQIYPNPSKGNMTVILPDGFVSGNMDLFDIRGLKVQQWKGINSNKLQIKNISPGVYLLKLVSPVTGKIFTKKIIVN